MISIKPLPEFTEWLDGLSDLTVRGVVLARIKRLALGLMGGGSKRTQKADIKHAKRLASKLD